MLCEAQDGDWFVGKTYPILSRYYNIKNTKVALSCGILQGCQQWASIQACDDEH